MPKIYPEELNIPFSIKNPGPIRDNNWLADQKEITREGPLGRFAGGTSVTGAIAENNRVLSDPEGRILKEIYRIDALGLPTEEALERMMKTIKNWRQTK